VKPAPRLTKTAGPEAANASSRFWKNR